MNTPYRKQLAKLVADTTKAVNTDFLAADFQLLREGTVCRISVATSTALLAIKLVPSSGTAISLGAAAANTVATYNVALDTGRTWNLQTSDAGGGTITHLVVQELDA